MSGPLDGVYMVPCSRGCGNVITIVSIDPDDRYAAHVCLPCAMHEGDS